MADSGHEITDEIIEEIEDRTRRIYSQAQREVSEKVEDYFYRFKVKDDIKRKKLAAGEITKQEYADWRKGQMLIGDRWKDLKDSIAQDYVNSNGIARSVAYGYAPDVYAINHNYATFQIEHDSMVDTSYTLYNREAVESLLKDDRNLLPYARTNSPKAKLLRDRMDLIWNRQHINTAITQGVIQGESIPQIAKRLQRVTDMNQAAAIRNARTMMTGVENKGRVDGYERLREKGIKLREKWISTLDSRTRHSHRLMHGTYKDERDGLYKNGLEYPGDPGGDPEEVYNCRCTEIAEVEGFTIETPKTSPKLGEMTFEEWLAEKGAPEKVKWWGKEGPKETGPLTFEDLAGVTMAELHAAMPQRDYSKMYSEMRDRSLAHGMPAPEYFEAMKRGDIKDPEMEKLLLQGVNRDMLKDPYAYGVLRSLGEENISRLPLVKRDSPKTFSQFVKDVGGGDQTEGSCASLSFCFAAHKAGYEIRDFRGGDSREFFSWNSNIEKIAHIKGVEYYRGTASTVMKSTMKLVQDHVTQDKNYILYTGRHAAIVTKDEQHGFLYLELQSRYEDNNGWHLLNEKALNERFGAPKKSKYEYSFGLIEVESLGKNESFPQIMEYINTEEGKQKKGKSGHER